MVSVWNPFHFKKGVIMQTRKETAAKRTAEQEKSINQELGAMTVNAVCQMAADFAERHPPKVKKELMKLSVMQRAFMALKCHRAGMSKTPVNVY
jgi:hypothetical protein